MTSQKPNPLSQSPIEDPYNTSSNTRYQYVAGLKHIGYVVGDPITNNTKNINENNASLNLDVSQRIVNGLYMREGGEVKRSGFSQRVNVIDQGRDRVESGFNSRTNSRIQYSPAPGVIVHQYPSRPARSPSPISINPNANIIPAANFIYNSPGGSSTQSKAVSYSPMRYTVTEQTTFSKPPPPPPTIIQNPSMVPLPQYQRCVNQCKLWQQKYNELYTLYTKIQTQNRHLKTTTIIQPTSSNTNTNTLTTITTNNDQITLISKQNKKLKQRVKELQRNQQRLVNNMQDIITKLVNKYRDSTIKESMLLLDRYRLEKKIGEKL